jgi:hypothetical protein
MAGSAYAAGPVTKAPEWHRLVVWDALFNGLSAGLFLVAGIGDLAAPEVLGPVARVAYVIAFVLLLADLACLVLDLGDPWRFHHMLRVFKPSSPMSLGVWSLTVYAPPAAAAAVLGLVPGGGSTLDWVRRAVVVLGLAPALALAVYKGVLFSTTSQPGWQACRWLGGYFSGSSLALGCGELLALSVLTGQEGATALLRPALGVLLVLSLVPLALVLAELHAALPGPSARGQLRYAGALSVGLGVVAPLGLLLGSGSALALLLAVLLLVLGALAFRSFLVRAPHLAARQQPRG